MNTKKVTFKTITHSLCPFGFDTRNGKEEIVFDPNDITRPQLTFIVFRIGKFHDGGEHCFCSDLEILCAKAKEKTDGIEIPTPNFNYFVNDLKKQACSYNRFVKKNNINKEKNPLFDSITIITASKKDNYTNKTTLEFNDLQNPVTLYNDETRIEISNTKLIVDGKEIKLYW